MTININRLPKGWIPMTQDSVDRAKSNYPAIVFTDISANPGGWLSVDFDRNSVPSVEANCRMLKACEGISSMSWHICSECGSHRGSQHSGYVFAICEECSN